MNVVASDRLVERAEQYIRTHPEATLPIVLGHFRLNPCEQSEERAIIEDILDRREDRGASSDTDTGTGTDASGGVRA